MEGEAKKLKVDEPEEEKPNYSAWMRDVALALLVGVQLLLG